ncbi:DUF488 domain-containing protein [Pseudomonas sp. Choline-3u-10]|jgi:uncharacterized protein (DUF488 family)|uniref:DUF488 domain-containing protein n=1 Tax=Pseudomonadaceae TaxID=135621 RepID=UPI000535BAF7|nr:MULTISPECIES: DUF488 domain-containing protein [Pseudomonadaceae]AZZ44591.1 DUF488 domain-containing protein [Pseudomonadaceae bacterium SI-3]MAL35544.1 DUF488 domain-containing protein [Pseudomonas sp.]BAP80571.1 hypothetical protein MT1_3396 [Pseudomonas sp. MT-1]KJJ64337.1 hypothetical protein RT21_06555 [Pseudomonas sp. 10B238]MBK3796540.1 DUF488 family protein [Stutzerimonas stutzeri]|tara:strand:+ start:2410 stop:2982 length:573 start_codon:yes stop_codon:yes gene_type:complete
MSPVQPQQIWTVGHSTRTTETFIALLEHYGIRAIADVRRFPGSRRLPQFMSANLEASLAEHGIAYEWIEALGGRRRATPGPSASAWRNSSFRGYAEHLHTDEFACGIQQLLRLAAEKPTAIMCAEVLWWRCHRSMVSDVLKLRGVEVLHIQDEQRLTLHPYTSPARLNHGELVYDVGIGQPLKTSGPGIS